MAKYNVGVGDAFPVDAEDRRSDEDDRRDRRDDRRPPDDRGYWRRPYRYRRHGFFFRLSVMLFVIWGALSIFTHHAPHGLLVAAGITLALSIVFAIFRSDDDWRARREDRRRWREERRRYWGDR